MKIKKPISTGAAAKPTMAGGVAIADRFRLDAQPVKSSASSAGKKAASTALAFAFVALVVAGILTYVLYDHWNFLMPT